jgi:hypothetical protein
MDFVFRGISPTEFTPIFYQNENPNHPPTLNSVAKGSKTIAGEFFMGGGWYSMVRQF